LEDVLEEIVGDIQDEHDTPENDVQQAPDEGYIVDGQMTLNDLTEILTDVEFPEEDIETVNGFMLYSLGHLPQDSEEIEIKYGAFSRSSHLCFSRNGRKFHFQLHNAWMEKTEEQLLASFLKNPTAQTFQKMEQSYYKIPLSLGYYDVDKSIRNYLKSSIQAVMPELIHQKELETISVLLNDGIITKGNIDSFIELAIDEAQKGGLFEIQLLLMDYKAQHFEFESIEERFKL
jgi:hypothetical protein